MRPSPVVLFRVDASVRMGTGHTVRCLTLADELRRRGARVHFVQRNHPGHMIDVIRDRGFETHTLRAPLTGDCSLPDGDYRGWAGVSEEEDSAECLPIVQATGAEWVVVDHYGIGEAWHSVVRNIGPRLMVIDDLANRPLNCDVVLDQNYFDDYESRYHGLLPNHCRRLFGPQYALLAPEYTTAREFVGLRDGSIARVLVFFGGSDLHDRTGFALRVLSRPEFAHLTVDVVVGRNYRHRGPLEAVAATRGRVKIWDSLPSLLPLMVRSDVAIGAGGATKWERCCVGLPSIVIPIAENQVQSCQALGRIGACVSLPFLGDDPAGHEVLEPLLTKELGRLLQSPRLASSVGEIGVLLGEGLGAPIVAELLIPSSAEEFALRHGRPRDAALLWRWAGGPSKHGMGDDILSIDWESHLRLFLEQLNSSDSMLWVLSTSSGVPLGCISVREDGRHGVLKFYIDPPFRGRGLARLLLKRAIVAWKHVRGNVPLSVEANLDFEGLVDSYSRERTLRKNVGSGQEPGREQLYSLCLLTDRDSWINEKVVDLAVAWLASGHAVCWVHEPGNLRGGDFLFMLGCSKIVKESELSRFRHNLVVHESAVPYGRGWSPLTWQVLRGAAHVPVTLLEAAAEVDSGRVYRQEVLTLSGAELIDDLRLLQAEASMRLCSWFVDTFPESAAGG